MRLRVLLVFLLIALIGGCRTKADDAYPARFSTLMNEFYAEARRVAEAPDLDLKRMTRDQVRTHLVEELGRTSNMYRGFADRAKRLEPPPKYQKLNGLVVRFFADQADGEADWARLVKARSPEARGMGDRIQRQTVAQLREVYDEIIRVDGKNERLEASLRGLEKLMAQ